MSTRKASDGAFHQEKFCSSPELEGDAINALMAAKRIALVNDRSAQEVLWFVQWRSLRPGGLQTLCDDILSNYSHRVGTETLCKFFASKRSKPGAAELEAMRSESHFIGLASASDFLAATKWRSLDYEAMRRCEWEEVQLSPREEADELSGKARSEARDGLKQWLRQCCVDPSADITRSPWYFIDLFNALKDTRAKCVAAAKARLADTLVSRVINNTLDFWTWSNSTKSCVECTMVLIEGEAGIGRTQTARAWCDAQAGLVRYVEVPSSTDDRSFYVSIARELGVTRGLSFSGQQIKLRVEETLRESGLMLALDESQYLWGNVIRPRKTPDRILWVKPISDAGTPIALVAHTDFSKWQEHFVKRTLWTDEQFERRINRRLSLPTKHDREDLLKIAHAHFPAGDERCWKLLAAYAFGAPKKRASAIVEALKSARFRAHQQGREEATFADIQAALREEHGFLKAPAVTSQPLPCNANAERLHKPRQQSAKARSGASSDSQFQMATRLAGGRINTPVPVTELV